MSRYSNSPVNDKLGAFIIGIVLVCVGIFLIISNNTSFDEYKNSTDKQSVVAEIKDMHVRTETVIRKHSGYSRTEKVKKYDCSLEYTLKDGNVIRYTETYSSPRTVGEKIPLNVYKDKYGSYQIATLVYEQDKKNADLGGYFVIGFGVLCFIVGALIKTDY